MKNRVKTSISREGTYFSLVVLVVLVGSIIREVNPMLLFGALLCAPLIITWRLGRRSLRGLYVRRRLPTQVFAGEPFIVQLETTNPRPKTWFSLSSWGIVIVDRIRPHRLEEEEQIEENPFEPAVYFEFLPIGSTVRKTYAGRLPRRGRYRAGPLLISTRFPFGFFRHSFEQPSLQGEKNEFCVYPKLGKLSARWRTRHHVADENQQRQRFRPSRISGEFLGIRRWQQGDEKKWIHWRAWARHREPVVRQFEQNQNRDCAVLLDLYHEGPLTERERENFELAVSFSATLVSEMTRRGGCNLFFATSRPEDDVPNNYLAGPISLPLVENILLQLAVVQPQRNDSLAQILLKAVSLSDPNAELILVTPRPIRLASSERFRELQNDPRFRALFQRLRVVDTSSEELETIFTV